LRELLRIELSGSKVRIRICSRPDCNRVLKSRDGVRVAPHREVNTAEIAVAALIIRRQRDHPSKHPGGSVISCLRVVEPAQPVIVGPVVGMETDCPLISVLCVCCFSEMLVSRTKPTQRIVACWI